MLGSFDEAEDLVQEVFLRAWRGRDGFEGRSSLRAWLYRIATNACLDCARRPQAPDAARSGQPGLPAWAAGVDPSRRPVAAAVPRPRCGSRSRRGADDPEAAAVARETLELAFLAAIQHLPPRQRAAMILCDVLGWPARQTAEVLDGSVASVNSALQRARATLRDAPAAGPVGLGAVRGADRRGPAGAAAIHGRGRARRPRLRSPSCWRRTCGRRCRRTRSGSPTVTVLLAALSASWDAGSPEYIGALRMLPTSANGQLAAASYRRSAGRAGLRAVRHRGAAGARRPDHRDRRVPRAGAVPVV